MKKHLIKIPLYDRELKIFITNNFKRTLKKIDKSLKYSDTLVASVIEDEFGTINLIIKPNADINTITHESFHITAGILEDAGLELNQGSEEAYAYLIGWVSEKIQNKLIKYNKNGKV